MAVLLLAFLIWTLRASFTSLAQPISMNMTPPNELALVARHGKASCLNLQRNDGKDPPELELA
jgi:hypothetical protein